MYYYEMSQDQNSKINQSFNVKSGGYINGNLMKCGKTSKVSKLFVVY